MASCLTADYFKRIKTTGQKSQEAPHVVPRRITKLSLNKRPFLAQKSASLDHTRATPQRQPSIGNLPETTPSSPAHPAFGNVESPRSKKPSSKPSVSGIDSTQNNLSSMTSQQSEKIKIDFCGKSELVLVPNRNRGRMAGPNESVLLQPEESVVIGDLNDQSEKGYSEFEQHFDPFEANNMSQKMDRSSGRQVQSNPDNGYSYN